MGGVVSTALLVKEKDDKSRDARTAVACPDCMVSVLETAVMLDEMLFEICVASD